MKKLRFLDEDAELQMEVVKERLTAIAEQLEQKQRDAERLVIKAPVAGTVIPPPMKQESPSEAQLGLASWSGSPFHKENLGATMMADGNQVLFCQIGNPNSWDATLVIGQRDLDLVNKGQEVRLMFEESAYHVFISKIQYVAKDKLEALSPRLASTSGGPIPAQADRDGTVKPLTTSYQAVVQLDNPKGLFRNGLIGKARITTEPRTLASRLIRYIGRTFNFDM